MATLQIAPTTLDDEEERIQCRHYWVIEAPEGPVSRGVCRICGEVQEFKNFIDSPSLREDTPSTSDKEPAPVKVSAEDSDDPDEE